MTAKRKDGKLPKERFHSVAEAKSLRTYAYNVSEQNARAGYLVRGASLTAGMVGTRC